ncbi:hypothetical protein PQX77_018326 [Marasmius sp. AFHP31]|nr:hypothetical protein PQX77_018326 [Marasmius sp. AFHP31]
MPGTQCKRCRGHFSDGGYLRHISTTANPECRIDQEAEYIPPLTSNLFERLYGHRNLMNPDPTGNHFGDYVQQDPEFGDEMDVDQDNLDEDERDIVSGGGGYASGLEGDRSDDELEMAADVAVMERECWEPKVPDHLKQFQELATVIQAVSPFCPKALDTRTLETAAAEVD